MSTLTKVELIQALRDMAEEIERNDSFEGFIHYDIIAPDKYVVEASYRTGNSQGQGGLRTL